MSGPYSGGYWAGRVSLPGNLDNDQAIANIAATSVIGIGTHDRLLVVRKKATEGSHKPRTHGDHPTAIHRDCPQRTQRGRPGWNGLTCDVDQTGGVNSPRP